METFLVLGLAGGVVRGLVGYSKYLSAYKNVKFRWTYFLVIVGISGVVGTLAGWIVSGVIQGEMNVFYAFLAGYAGGDFLENAYKIVFKKTSIFKIPDIPDVLKGK